MHHVPLLANIELICAEWIRAIPNRNRLVLKTLRLLLVFQAVVGSAVCFGGDWPWWRGPAMNGTADAEQSLPTKWSDTENVVWKTAIPGRGHGSPTVVGDFIYLATAERDREARAVVCINRNSGEIVWSRDVHVGNLTPFKNKKGSDASSTIACDGERLFVNFLHDDAMFTSALSMHGEVLWQTRISSYIVHQAFGSSPAIFGPLVIVTADNKSGGAISGLNRTTGEIVWKQDRPTFPNYASPIVLDVAGKAQCLVTGCELVTSLDPLTGNKNWETEGATTECVTSTLVCGDLMFTSGGYPKNHVSAVRCDGSKEIVWENGTRVYVPSMLVSNGYLYGVADAGVAVCWRCSDGEELWKGRLGGTFSASPVLVGDQILATNEEGTSFIFKANPKEFELVAKNQLGEECFATPTVCNSHIYMRVATVKDEQRQEYVVCVGEGK